MLFAGGGPALNTESCASCPRDNSRKICVSHAQVRCMQRCFGSLARASSPMQFNSTPDASRITSIPFDRLHSTLRLCIPHFHARRLNRARNDCKAISRRYETKQDFCLIY